MKFFDFILRNKLSLGCAVVFQMFIFIYANIDTVEFKMPKPKQDEMQVIAVMDFTKEEEEIEEMAGQAPDPNQFDANGEIINAAANQNLDKTQYTSKTQSKESMDQAVEDELRRLEQETFDQLAQDNPELKNPNDVNNDGPFQEGATENDNAGYGADIRTTADYSLPSRKHLIKEIPSYVCKSEGVVTIIIKVNQKGNVVAHEIDETRTNTSNDCLRKNSLDYAKKWKFNQDFNDAIRKQGWIQFTYVKQ